MFTTYYEVLALQKAKEQERHGQWNRLRWAVFQIVWKIPGKKPNWPRAVERMFPFPWDFKAIKEPVDCVVTEDEEAAFLAIFKDFQAKKGNE